MFLCFSLSVRLSVSLLVYIVYGRTDCSKITLVQERFQAIDKGIVIKIRYQHLAGLNVYPLLGVEYQDHGQKAKLPFFPYFHSSFSCLFQVRFKECFTVLEPPVWARYRKKAIVKLRVFLTSVLFRNEYFLHEGIMMERQLIIY